MSKVFYIESFTGEVVKEFTALDFLRYAKCFIENCINKKIVVGLCGIYRLFILSNGYKDLCDYYIVLTEVIPELKTFKQNSNKRYWWPFTAEGMKERLKVVNELIEKYEAAEK